MCEICEWELDEWVPEDGFGSDECDVCEGAGCPECTPYTTLNPVE